jgi:hypothetical protein
VRRAQFRNLANIPFDRNAPPPKRTDLLFGLGQLGGRRRRGIRGRTDITGNIKDRDIGAIGGSSTAIARPIPRAAPVTNATLPASCVSRAATIAPALRGLAGTWALARLARPPAAITPAPINTARRPA